MSYPTTIVCGYLEENITCFATAMYIAEGEPDTEDVEDPVEKTVENVTDLCASANEAIETSENKASVSIEGPDSSDVMTPDSAGNVDTALSVGVEADSSAGDKDTVTDTTHLNTDSVTPNALSPVNSPVHVVRTLITQDDPLGVFTSTVTSTASKMTTDPRTSRSSDDVVESARMEAETVLMRRISEDTIGQTTWVAAATDSSLRKCSSLNRLSSEYAHQKTLVTRSAAGNQGVVVESDSRPSSASPRTSLLGGTFRSAASRFALKYREIRESMAPPSQQVPPGTSQDQCAADTGDATPTDTVDVTIPETDYTAMCGGEITGLLNTYSAGKTKPDITVTTQSGKSRLRVPTALYSPLGKSFILFAVCLLGVCACFIVVMFVCMYYASLCQLVTYCSHSFTVHTGGI